DYVSKVAQTFMADMKDGVQKAWSRQYGLQWKYDMFTERFTALVEVVLDARFRFTRPCPAHVQIGIHQRTPGERSCAGGGGAGLQEGDIVDREHKRDLFPGPQSKKTKGYTFEQTTTVHEFGHLMGLDHIAGKGNDTRNYGMTPD